MRKLKINRAIHFQKAKIQSENLNGELVALFNCKATNEHSEELLEALLPNNARWCRVDLVLDGEIFIEDALIAVYLLKEPDTNKQDQTPAQPAPAGPEGE